MQEDEDIRGRSLQHGEGDEADESETSTPNIQGVPVLLVLDGLDSKERYQMRRLAIAMMGRMRVIMASYFIKLFKVLCWLCLELRVSLTLRRA